MKNRMVPGLKKQAASIQKPQKTRRAIMSEIKKLENLFTLGKLTRREFVTKLSAFGLMAAVSPALLSGKAMAGTPKKGGRFIQGLATGSTTDSLDCGTFPDNGIVNLNWQLRNNLVEINYKGEPIPELAESWEASADAAKWRFHLRKGVEFHNGKSLDAEDVIHSFNHHRGEASKSAAKSLLDAVKDIKADGKQTVVFTLEGGNADFPAVVSENHFAIVPAGTKGKAWQDGIGTGGYILEEFVPGVRAFTRRNPNYWKKGRAHFDEIETLYIADTNSRTNALKSGQIHFMARCEFKTARFMEKLPNIQILRTTSGFEFSNVMWTDTAPYDNNDVRMALKYAVDREHMVKTILQGYGTVGNDNPIGPTYKYHDPEIPQRQYDPDKAKFHLKKAGLSNPTFDLFTSPHSGFDDQALLFKEHAAKAGININVIRKPKDGYWSNVWMKQPFCSCHWDARPTADMKLTIQFALESNWNDTHFKHERFNKVLKEARAELDEAKRREMYSECQRIIRDEGGQILHMFRDNVDAADKKIKFKNLAGNYGSDGIRNSERWWFD
jgi:peptide/nickel transport system substrate-binding protein